MNKNMDQKIKEYIEKQKSPQKEIITKIRKIILNTFNDCDEKVGWGVIVYKEGKFYLAGLKDKVHLGFSILGLTKEERELFEGSGKTMRHIKFYELNDINEKEIIKFLKIVDKKAKCVGCNK